MIRAKITEPCFVAGGLRERGAIITVRDEEFADHCMERVLAGAAEESEANTPDGEAQSEDTETQQESVEESEGQSSYTRKRVVKKNA